LKSNKLDLTSGPFFRGKTREQTIKLEDVARLTKLPLSARSGRSMVKEKPPGEAVYQTSAYGQELALR